MQRIYYILIIFLLTLAELKKSFAQVDPHTSQYYMNPLILNPANTGAFNGEFRIAAAYRNQWRDITNAFSTVALTLDANTSSNLNVGINILSQSAGDAGYNFTTAAFSVAYTGIRFGKGNYQRIAIGLQAGMMHRKVDPSKFKFGDQWNAATGFSPANPTNDILNTTSNTSFDAAAGILYYDGSVDKKINPYLGFSAFHLSKPKDPFIASGNKDVVPIRYAAHAGVSIKMSDVVTVVPNILYMRQGNAEEKMAGAYVQLNVSERVDFLIGANYRMEDAVSPFAGFSVNRFTFGLSYDANVSQLGKMAGNANNFELTLSYITKQRDRLNMDFLKCPRL